MCVAELNQEEACFLLLPGEQQALYDVLLHALILYLATQSQVKLTPHKTPYGIDFLAQLLLMAEKYFFRVIIISK